MVIDAATTLMEVPALINYDARDKGKKKTQYVYADFINRARAKHFEDVTMDHGSKEDRARFERELCRGMVTQYSQGCPQYHVFVRIQNRSEVET